MALLCFTIQVTGYCLDQATTISLQVGRLALSVQRLATGWTIRGSNPGGGRDFPYLSRPALGPTQPPVNGYRVFPGDKERPGRDADPLPPSSAVGH